MSAADLDGHHWLGRLSMCLAVASRELPDPLRSHVRKTLSEFAGSAASTTELARLIRAEAKR